VISLTLRFAKGAALVVTLGLVASCGLPRSGPNKSEIYSGSVLEQGDAFVLVVDDRVNRIAPVTPALGFSAGFTDVALLARIQSALVIRLA
jgi:polysaccharide export outer membrane protein